ncbi:MAG: peptidoglycan domain protein [Bacteroidales bacterium]|nr:peptidoglycan domain protein [Bacteroidales bacterium]
MANAEILKPFLLSWEGGFVNDPDDRGGATNKGVTITTFRSVFGQDKTVDDLKHITDEQWLQVFKKFYWDKCKADLIESQSVANILVDWFWCSGTKAIRSVQTLVGTVADGVIGAKTIAAINNYNAGSQCDLFELIHLNREAYIKEIAVGSQAKYKRGWMRRLNGIQYRKLVYNNGKTVQFK